MFFDQQEQKKTDMEQSTELQAQLEAFLDASGSANAGVVAGEFYFGVWVQPLFK